MRDVLLIVAGILAGAGIAMAVEAVKMTVATMMSRIVKEFHDAMMEKIEEDMLKLEVADFTPSGPEYLELDDVMNVIRRHKEAGIRAEVRDGEND